MQVPAVYAAALLLPLDLFSVQGSCSHQAECVRFGPRCSAGESALHVTARTAGLRTLRRDAFEVDGVYTVTAV